VSNGIVLDLTATFVNYQNPRTPFATFDNDAAFQSDCDGMIKQVYKRLGGDVLQVELTNTEVYAAMEQAFFEYSAIVNTYQTKSTLLHLLGYTTGSMSGSENKLPRFDLAFAKRKSEGYSSEALVGGTRQLYSASITLNYGQQHYDLNYLLSASQVIPPGQKAEIRQIFHFSPTAAYRFFDTTSAINYLHNQFQFESFTPETVFYMLPIWEDVLRAQQLELNQNVRRSNYSYNLVNNVLSVYPVPTANSAGNNLFFTYYLNGGSGSNFDANDPFTNGVSNLSNIPYGNLTYTNINSIGRQWVKKLALAFSKETLGRTRSKMSTIPIPNGDLTLDGPALVQEALMEQENLRTELKAWLDELTYTKLAQQQVEEADALQRVLSKIPMGVFIG
jgi:hypothetical protein